ncbi:MAG: acyl-ACP--UDP-N-acetylglucosamine O-acyltransferase [Planctomycetaceae bacterium]|jgi:UDP-N-acetylglucosamine acyltransferase|nr:acyl-ACP--UDP-N-acetylglucosamine O-acyltransferase [Planctomycetaceae bacterium]
MNTDLFSVISPSAKIGSNVEIGHFCVIEPDVVIGKDCRIASHVTIKRGVVIGEKNIFYEGVTIGNLPQHTAVGDDTGNVVIGDNNIFRENVTVHRAMHEPAVTKIGDSNYFMVNAHVAHDCKVGNNNVIVNNVMLAGHVEIGNRVNIGGAVGVHQFCRIGSYAMVGAQAHVIQDVLPYVTVDGLTSRIVGLNLIGLRRNGYSTSEINILKEVYRLVYRSGIAWKEILQKLQESYSTGVAAEITRFILATKRGIVHEGRYAENSLIKFSKPTDNKSNNESANNEESPALRINAG